MEEGLKLKKRLVEFHDLEGLSNPDSKENTSSLNQDHGAELASWGSNVIIRALTLGLSALKEKQMFFISSDSVLSHLDPVKHVSCQVRIENFEITRSPRVCRSYIALGLAQ